MPVPVSVERSRSPFNNLRTLLRRLSRPTQLGLLALWAAVAAASCDKLPPNPDAGVIDLAMTGGDGCATLCGAECVDLTSDPKNCGACGKACDPAQLCMGGVCGGGSVDMTMKGDLSAAADMSKTPDMTVVLMDGGMTMGHRCNATPPAGAKVAPPAPRYAGTCPMLVPGKNTINTAGGMREFLLAVPSGLMTGEKLPLVFLWHWLGGSADSFFKKAEIQAAVDGQRFLAIAPVAKSDMLFKWPFDIGVSDARQEEEFKFFEDMLACAAVQFNVNLNCVSSAGVSAGALFTAQLAGKRSQYLSSALVLSGGVSGITKPFGTPAHKLPTMVLWGGSMDNCLGLVDFNDASKKLEDELIKGGHFFLECIHNCGHAEPPFDTPMGLSKYAGLWNFVFDHPYWLDPGVSPYTMVGLPTGMPGWCAIGKGKATPRTGMCPDKPGC